MYSVALISYVYPLSPSIINGMLLWSLLSFGDRKTKNVKIRAMELWLDSEKNFEEVDQPVVETAY